MVNVVEMIAELNAASDLMATTIERYLNACLAIENYFLKGNRDPQFTVHAANELVSFAAFESKVQRAKIAIKWVRNRSPSISPANTLPSEVLVYIFKLVLQIDPRPCAKVIANRRCSSQVISKYPDIFTHVCSHWRQVALCETSLWSHIDLTPSLSVGLKLRARAETYAARAGQSLLDVDVLDKALPPGRYFQCYTNIADFIASIAPRIRSFSVVAHYKLLVEPHSPIILGCLENASPGTLRRLALIHGIPTDTDSGPNPPLTNLTENPGTIEDEIACSWLNDPGPRMREVLLDITNLDLRGLFFEWASTAYRNLTELRLIPDILPSHRRPTCISQWRLGEILKSSPRLRVIQIEILIHRDGDTSCELIPLNELQELDLSLRRPTNATSLFLELIAPSSKPLQLSISDPALIRPTLTDKAKNFLINSNIPTLRVRVSGSLSYTTCVITSQWLCLMPRVRTLALYGIWRGHGGPFKYSSAFYRNSGDRGARVPCSQLDTLHILRREVDIDELIQIVKGHSFRNLVFWDCRFCGPGVTPGWEWEPDLEHKALLSSLCPSVKFLSQYDPFPIDENWEGLY
ncbi:F-box-like domain containing protein [Ceratobasidium theobromae]|uniref:F-box-like domain containing protein n=1 Tax=Ceratobasidium theobromae TaxID=1582974 RepID=A0A5N5QD98_9AGAM|nr:F-box-like domain containing protein [Ceratobasidium theobromae]